MAVPVVVLLEVIDIQHHHAGGMRDAAVGERRQYLTELSSVEQPGQDVGILFDGQTPLGLKRPQPGQDDGTPDDHAGKIKAETVDHIIERDDFGFQQESQDGVQDEERAKEQIRPQWLVDDAQRKDAEQPQEDGGPLGGGVDNAQVDGKQQQDSKPHVQQDTGMSGSEGCVGEDTQHHCRDKTGKVHVEQGMLRRAERHHDEHQGHQASAEQDEPLEHTEVVFSDLFLIDGEKFITMRFHPMFLHVFHILKKV
jgi:hypothetical protein